MQNIFEFDIDLKKQNFINEPVMTQNDYATFVINVLDNDEPVDLAGATTITLASLRPDQKSIIIFGERGLNANQIVFEISRPENAIVGRVEATVQFYDADSRVSTAKFNFRVEKDPSNISPSGEDKTLIELVLGEGPAILDAVNLALPNIENLEPIGEYDVAVDYLKNNIVSLDGASYMAKSDTIGNDPTDDAFWLKIANKGDVGPQGIQGPEGPEGPIGPEGPQGIPGQNGTGAGTVTAVNGELPDGTGNVTLTGLATAAELQAETQARTTHEADLAKVGLDYSGDSGNPRGTDAVDLQHSRVTTDQVAGGRFSFVSGSENMTKDIVERGLVAVYARAMGRLNRAHAGYSRAEGRNCFADGQVAHAEGNVCIASGNDSHAEGNRTVTGRKYFTGITTGLEDAGNGLGVLEYVLIPAIEGDVSSYFPNALTDNVTTRYGTGAQKDVKGNIYPNGYTPAIWTGDVPTTSNDLQWALHSVCILRGPSEPNIEYANIAKSTYSAGVGTKVYYFGAKPFISLMGIYCSYSPLVSVGGIGGRRAGNGNHAQGLFTSAYGYGAHAQGGSTRAWADYAHAQGYESEASGVASFAGGQYSRAFRTNQRSVAAGQIANRGDNQLTNIQYTKTCVGAGWHQIVILGNCEDGKAYNFETMVTGRQISGTAGSKGDTFAYKFNGCVVLKGGTFEVLGDPNRTLIGRSSGMTGDGLATGVRLSWDTAYLPSVINLRMDGLADTTYQVTTSNVIQEMGL